MAGTLWIFITEYPKANPTAHYKNVVTNTDSMTLNMQVYSVNETVFDPLDHSIDSEMARRSTKRFYKPSRPVQKSTVLLDSS